MQNKLKIFITVAVFLMSSYSASVYSAALTQATDNSFAPGGSANDVTLLQDSLITIQGFNECL